MTTHWISRTQALGELFDAAHHSSVQLLKPNVAYVAIPKRTLNNEAELEVAATKRQAKKTAQLPCSSFLYILYIL